MLVKILLVSSAIFSMNLSMAQETNMETKKMIKHFVQDLFDDNIPSEDVVNKYLFFEIDSGDINKVQSKATGHIDIIRKRTDEDGGWLLPDNKVALAKNTTVERYIKYENISTVDLNMEENQKENVYVLLNAEKNEILQYFYIKNNRIISFSLFVKTNKAWFFTY